MFLLDYTETDQTRNEKILGIWIEGCWEQLAKVPDTTLKGLNAEFVANKDAMVSAG